MWQCKIDRYLWSADLAVASSRFSHLRHQPNILGKTSHWETLMQLDW